MRIDTLWSTVVPVVLAMVLCGSVLATNEWAHRAARESQTNVAERTRLRVQTNGVLHRLVDAETAQRGYLITGRAQYLEPYRDADADVLRGLAQVRGHFGRYADARDALEALERAARDKLAELASTIAMYDAGDHATWREVVDTDRGKASMDGARAAARRLLDGEDRRIDAEQSLIVDVLDRGGMAVRITTLLALVWFVFFMRKNRALRHAQQAHARDLEAQRDVLEAQVGARTAELRELNEHLQDVREVERSKLARQLHDELGSMLTAAKLDLTRLKRVLPQLPPAAAERLDHLGRAIDDGAALKRRIIEELSPSALHNLGLRAALEILVGEFRERSGLKVTLDIDDVALADSPRIVVYRLVQECLDNLEQHAGGVAGAVVVRRDGDHVVVRVSDRGRGFDPSNVPPGRHGLRKLRHRVDALGGRMRIVSAPDGGTDVEARLPVAVPGWDVAAQQGAAVRADETAPSAASSALSPPPSSSPSTSADSSSTMLQKNAAAPGGS